MKYILVFAALLVFAYVAFVPPDGVSKYPVAKINFSVDFEDHQEPAGK